MPIIEIDFAQSFTDNIACKYFILLFTEPPRPHPHTIILHLMYCYLALLILHLDQ